MLPGREKDAQPPMNGSIADLADGAGKEWRRQYSPRAIIVERYKYRDQMEELLAAG